MVTVSCQSGSAEHGADRGGQRGGHVLDQQVPAVADHVPAAGHDVADVRGGGREQDALQRGGFGGRRPAAGVSSATVTRSASAPGAISPASGQPRQACPAAVAARASSAGAEVAALAGGQPLGQLDPAGLREQVDRPRGCRCPATAGSRPRPARGPGRSRRPGRPRWSGRSRRTVRLPPSSSMSPAGQVGGVHHGAARAERAGARTSTAAGVRR